MEKLNLLESLKEELILYGIGDTLLTRSRNIEKLLSFKQLWLKFEAGNPTGTMKDRATYACLKLAKEQGFDSAAIASCGNFGASFVHLGKKFNMEVHVYIPMQYHTPRIQWIENEGGILHQSTGTYEELVKIATQEAEENGWFNGNPGAVGNTKASIEAYATISLEILHGIKHSPDFVSVPVGNGTTLAGIYNGFKILRDSGNIDNIPSMIAVSTMGGNPVIECFKKGLKKIMDLDPSSIRETEHNEPLVSWRSLDGQEALDALKKSEGWATYVSDDALLKYSEILASQEGLLVLPASSSSLAALHKYIQKYNKKKRDITYIAILTGRHQ